MPNFVDDFIAFTKEDESPESFWRWSAYALIGAVLRDSVFIEHARGKIYPNIYVLLLADSAVSRKGGPFGLVEDLFLTVGNSKCFSGSASVQGVLEKLSIDKPQKKGMPTVRGGSGFVIAEELSSFFVEDPRLVALLTRMSDYKAYFPYDLRGSPIEITGLCLSMLMASNYVLLKNIFNLQAVYGGLLRRTLVVKPNERRPPSARMDISDAASLDATRIRIQAEKGKLISAIKHIGTLKGACLVSTEASTLYKTWYNDLYLNYEKYGSKAGVVEGMHALVQKIAIIKTAARGVLEMERQDVEEAILETTALLRNYEEFVVGVGKSDAAEIGGVILKKLYMAPNKFVSRSELLLQYWMDMSSEDLEKIATTMCQAGIIEAVANGKVLGFRLTAKGEEFLKPKKVGNVVAAP